MSFFRNLFGGGSSRSTGSSDPNSLWLYVQCNKCGAPLAVRVDRRNEISQDYESGGMVLRKEMMDSTCFQIMYAEVQFDAQGHITGETVEKGKILTQAEYETLKAEWDASKN